MSPICRSSEGNSREANSRVRTSVGHGEQTGGVVLVDEVLVGELLTVDGLTTSALYCRKSGQIQKRVQQAPMAKKARR